MNHTIQILHTLGNYLVQHSAIAAAVARHGGPVLRAYAGDLLSVQHMLLTTILFMPPLDGTIPDPGHQIACLVQPMVIGVLELAATVGVVKLGLRAISERSGEDLPKIFGMVILVAVLAGIIFVPATMNTIIHKVGMPASMNLVACTA